MGRGYKRKTDKVDTQVFQLAVLDIKNGKSLRETARKFNIPRTTLLRHKRANDNIAGTETSSASTLTASSLTMSDIQIRGIGRSTVFDKEQEKYLKEFLLHYSDIFFGMTSKDARSLAYQFACKLHIEMPKNWKEDQLAGLEWFRGFMSRHSTLSLRTLEATSLGRVGAFNRHNVNTFFTLLRKVSSEILFEAHSVWNVDETGITTRHYIPQRVISRRGIKQIDRVTSAERGQLITMILAVSAGGNKIPPFYVFPRTRFQEHFLNGGPTGCAGAASPSGWTNADIFLDFLKHFQKFTRVSIENPLLLLLDNHESHKSFAALKFCKTNGIHILSFPPHCSHRLQPLDVSVFGLFKKVFNAQCDNWMRVNPGRTMTIYDMPQITARVLELSITEQNIKSGFRATGIWPLDPDIFQEIDFLPSSVTDRPIEHSEIEVNLDEILQSICPLPKAPPCKNTDRRRKPGKATILTDNAAIETTALEEATKQMHQLRKTTQTRARNTRKPSKPANSSKKEGLPQPGCSTGDKLTRSGLRNTKSIKYHKSSDSD